MTVAKVNRTKKALVSSVLSMLLCFSMLIGTTFAWFTDTASTGVNKIQAGNLDVTILKYDYDDGWLPAEGETLEFERPEGAEGEILWEPGCTYYLPQLRVKNDGNLALKYKIVITGIMGDAKLNEAIEWSMKLLEEEDQDFEDYDFDREYVLFPDEYHDLEISGHMMETAGNEYQGLSIEGIAITVIATQAMHEVDSIDASYDEYAAFPVVTVDELKAAVAGGYASLGSDITVPPEKLGEESGYGKSGVSQLNGGVIDGNGHIISAEGADGLWDATIYTRGGTIKNATITGANRGIFIAYPTEDIIVDNVIINPGTYAIQCDAGSGKNLIVTNSTFNGRTSLADTLATATFTNCMFGSNGTEAALRPYGSIVLINCTFETEFNLHADTLKDDNKITLINCKYDDTLITAENLETLGILEGDADSVIINND